MKKEEVPGISAGVVGGAENYADKVTLRAERGHGFAAEKANHLKDVLTGKNAKLIPLKIGYEFLALLLGTAIYKKDSALDELRIALRQGIEDHPSFHVESLNASEYKPCHERGYPGCPISDRRTDRRKVREHLDVEVVSL